MRPSSRLPTLTLLLLFSLLAGPACAQSFLEEVTMRDGVQLATDVYLPPGDGPFPAILSRTPYGRGQFADEAATYNGYGIAVVSQDMRGRYDSGGEDRVFTSDGDGTLKDGYDTMQWLVDQPWSDGLIGTTGGSALGIVQYMQTSASPPGLAVINPIVATPNLYQDAIFWGGVRRYALSHNWLEGQGSLHFEQEFINHPYEDAFWDSTQTADRYSSITVPGLHEGGWFDIFLQGTLDGFMGYHYEGGPGAAGAQKLIIGPWTHMEMHQQLQGELRFPSNATAPPFPQAFDVLFNHYLQVGADGVTEVPDDIPNVQYYVMGDVDDAAAPGNAWRTGADWPPAAAPVRLHLQAGGGLDEACPAPDGGTTSYSADPADPVPTRCGGNMTIDAGSCDQRPVEARDDVVLFETPILSSPLELVGRLRAHLFVDIDRPDTDLMVRLSDVYPDGRSMLIADGALRLATRGSTTGLIALEPGEVVEGVVDLWSTAIVFNEGHRLRISISSSNYPRFSVNQNNGLDYPASVEEGGAPVLVRLHHEQGFASYLEAPDPTRAPLDFSDCSGARGDDDDDTAADDDEVAPAPELRSTGCALASGDATSWASLALLPLLGIRRRRR